MLVGRCGQAERLLHKTIRFVAIAIRPFLSIESIVDTVRVAFGRLVDSGGIVVADWGYEAVSSTLAFHLSVGQKTSGYATGAPAFAIGPSSHASLSLIPNEYRTRTDTLSFLLR